MRILMVHNFYGSSAPSGENRAVSVECDVLTRAGHEVFTHFTSSDTIRDRGILPVLAAAITVPWNPIAVHQVREKIRRLAPDVMHVHNVFPLLSPAIFRAARGTDTAVVNTLHNYRTVCPAAVPLREGQICTECIDSRNVASAVRHACYRGSHSATVPVAVMVALHRWARTYQRDVDAFIALTDFQRHLLVEGGLPADRMFVRPNCFPGRPHRVPWRQREDKAVFVGRISREKGVSDLVAAWLQDPALPRLEIVGAGPELATLRDSIPPRDAERIRFLGAKAPELVHKLLASAKLLVVPSTWFEGFPLVLSEAFAFGVPVAASRIGTFEELVYRPGAGTLFAPGSARDLGAVVSELWRNEDRLQEMARASENEFETRYNEHESLRMSETIYRSAIQLHRERKGTRKHHGYFR